MIRFLDWTYLRRGRCAAAMLLGVALLLVLGRAACAGEAQWPEVARSLAQEAKDVRAASDAARRAAGQDVAAREAALAARRAAVQRTERDVEARKKRLALLLEEEAALRRALDDRQRDMALVASVARAAARDAEKLLRASPAAALRTDRLAHVRGLLDTPGLPSFEILQALCDALREQALDGNAPLTIRGSFLGRAGLAQDGDILLVAPDSAYFVADDGDLGGLVVGPEGLLAATPGRLDHDAREGIAATASGSVPYPAAPRRVVPVDMSGGAWLRAEPGASGPLATLRSGGVLVWPILGVGVVGMLLGLERAWTLTRLRMASDGVLERLEAALRAGRAEDGRSLCAAHGASPACRVLEAGLGHAGSPRDVLENVFHDAMLREAPRLERFLPTIAVLGAVAPLLGLLGTVTGMIKTFGVMTLLGNSNASLLAGGISEALVTTQLGLAVAIPLLLAHHLLERRVDAMLGDMEEKSVAFTVVLLGNREEPQ
ncbi:MAG: MotA/TolQ/ExbB proton channel family protein [Desulfovibrionaceae bacterium]